MFQLLQVRGLLLMLLVAPRGSGAVLIAGVPFRDPYTKAFESCPPDSWRSKATVTVDVDFVVDRVPLHVGFDLVASREVQVHPAAMGSLVFELYLPRIVSIEVLVVADF